MNWDLICAAEATVMFYDDKTRQWVDEYSGRPAHVRLLQSVNHFRIIASFPEDDQFILNCTIHQKLKYQISNNPCFHQWRDEQRQVYGLSFANEASAQKFGALVLRFIKCLSEQVEQNVYQEPQQVNGMEDPRVIAAYRNPTAQQFGVAGAPQAWPGNLGHDTRRTSQGSTHSSTNIYAQVQNGAAAVPYMAHPASAPTINNNHADSPPRRPNGASIPPAPPPPPSTGGLPPISTNAPPPPPPPPPPSSAASSSGASFADQIKNSKLRKTSAPVGAGTTPAVEEKPKQNGGGGGDLLKELHATFSKRKTTRAGLDAMDSKSNISNGSSDSGSGTIAPPPPPSQAKKTNGFTSDNTTNGNNHRKIPSTSSINSEDLRSIRPSVDTQLSPELERIRNEIIEANNVAITEGLEKMKKEIVKEILAALGR